ncbi:MAG TPA: [NiFe]-hydrogenase assembly, chaperone, HybE [Gammaproteobacteria bacterium]|nr:[NiFe]-hydrogenase assembly, chaperone, HybE [Gammaproteobacteria bacterium]
MEKAITKPIEIKLEQLFSEILTTRMQGVPVVNKRLTVKAIGFHQWNEQFIGVLLTPWFMNIMLLPENEESEAWQDLMIGQEIAHQLPSGRYTFVVGFEEDLGFYQSCSLFSPMFEFENQQAAELTAEEAVNALFDKENEDISSQHPAEEIDKIWKGEALKPEIKPIDNEDAEMLVDLSVKPKSLQEKLQEPVSRRDFLRGRVLRDNQ